MKNLLFVNRLIFHGIIMCIANRFFRRSSFRMTDSRILWYKQKLCRIVFSLFINNFFVLFFRISHSRNEYKLIDICLSNALSIGNGLSHGVFDIFFIYDSKWMGGIAVRPYLGSIFINKSTIRKFGVVAAFYIDIFIFLFNLALN